MKRIALAPVLAALVATFVWPSSPVGAAHSIVNCGLTHVLLGQAVFTGSGFSVGTNSGDGVSILLGQADAGIFVTPGIFHYIEDGDYLDAAVYGQLDGVTNQRLTTVRGHKTDTGYYSADVDFSPLNPASVTVQYYAGTRLMGEITNSLGASNQFVINTLWWGAGLRRVAPFWRMPDGSIGALFEFTGPAGFGWDDGINEEWQADRFFVRADHPTNVVDFVTRVDVTSEDVVPWHEDSEPPVTGTGVIGFTLDDVRLGMFHRPHRALDEAVFGAAVGALTIGTDEFHTSIGVAVELAEASTFDVNLLPIDLSDPESALILTGVGTASGEVGTEFGTLRIENTNESFQISAHFNVAPAFAQIVVLSHGRTVGTVGVTRDLVFVSLSSVPRIVGCGLRSRRVEEAAGFVVRLEQSTIFTAWDGTMLEGDELRLLAGDPVRFETFELLALTALAIPSFTITGESQQPFVVPSLTITQTGTNIVITWPDPNQIFELESSEDEPMDFETVDAPVSFSNNHRSVTLPQRTDSNWFFRLRHGAPRLPPPVD